MTDSSIADFDLGILRSICSTGYSDWTDDADALAACQRLEAKGFCRIAWDHPTCWRVLQSDDHLRAAMAMLDRVAS